MALITLQVLSLIIGVFNMWTRIFNCCTQCCFCCFNLVVFIYSGVLRFNTQGSLSAISQTPIYPEGSAAATASQRTYEMDGKLILSIWIFSAFFVCMHCCGACYVSASPKREHAAEYGVTTGYQSL